MFNTTQRIHLIGIGGIGMSGIAEILMANGYRVSGSDIAESTTTQHLSNLGANIYIGHDKRWVADADVVVVSSAIPEANPEIIQARIQKTTIIHRSEMLAELMRLKYGILVAGTHGKTTTTSMMASVLSHAQLDPTVVIGGKLNAYKSSVKSGAGELFLAEADESDGSFLRLIPTIAVVTNIDRDHMDHYDSLETIVKTFKSFIDKVPFYGAVCACADDSVLASVLPDVRRRLVTFGLTEKNDITATDIKYLGFSSVFTPVVFGTKISAVTLPMPGSYNIANALASFAVGHVLKIDPEVTASALSQFQGVLHRFTVVGQVNNITVIDDYAHNPAKIQAVLRGIRNAFPNCRLTAIFQPHRYTRVHSLFQEFAESFSCADHVIVAPIYAASELPIEGVTQKSIACAISQHSFDKALGQVAIAADFQQVIEQTLSGIAKDSKQDIIITLGAGDIQKIAHEIFATAKGNTVETIAEIKKKPD